MPPRRTLVVAIFLIAFITIIFSSRYAASEDQKIGGTLEDVGEKVNTPPPKEKDAEFQSCTEHLGWLEHYQFSYPIKYVSRDIIARPRADGERPPLTVMDTPLFGAFSDINLDESQTHRSEKCLPPLELDVPHRSMMKVDASNMIFGLQTTMNRLKDTVKHLQRWLPNTGARLYAIVIESEADDHTIPANDEQMKTLEKEFRDLGMLVSVIHPVRPRDSFAQRYFSLANVMYGARDDKTQWIIHIDDDTFFPSMWDLKNMLAKQDWTKPQYVGSLSEDWWAVNHYGLMGFGGAGIMLSLPMAKIIDDHTDQCKEHLRTTAGDISVMDCVYRFSPAKLTHISSLHQVDMHGDLSGFYESGREVLSLHHWKEGSAAGYKLEMEKMHLVADICDSCFLQRWQFPNELLLSNGFSITTYPQGHLSGKRPGALGSVGLTVDKLNLDDMEYTWADEINVLHSLAPTREKLPEEKKNSFKLLDSMLVKGDEIGAPGEKVVRQIYFREGGEGEGKNGIDTIMVLNWRSAKEDASQPPPRHEIMKEAR
jgi:hypothetical protein